jgi:effector-binding domain-containing protein
MSYDIRVETVTAVPLAAVRRRVRPGEVSAVWRPALDEVWAFLRANDGVWAGGHNVFVYHRPVPPDGVMVAEFGVEVVRAFEPVGEVEFTQTPAGEVASTVHVGPIADLGGAQAAIESWRAAHGRTFAGISWETYGDWGDDPSKHEVRLSYLLEDAT